MEWCADKRVSREGAVYRLGIVTPLLQVDDHARELAASIETLRSTGHEFIHLIVHAETGESLKEVFPHSEFLEEKRGTKGVYGALQQGFAHLIANGVTHLSWINADDLLEDGFRDVMFLSRKCPYNIAGGKVRWIGENGESFGQVPQWTIHWGMRELFAMNIPPFTQQGMIFPKELWVALGGFNPDYELIADSVFWDKALKLGALVRFSPAMAASYRMRKGQLSGNQEKSLREYVHWKRQLACKGWSARVSMGLIKVFFRIRNAPIYCGRVKSGLKLRSTKAMKEGGF
jgi:hypothetical protein